MAESLKREANLVNSLPAVQTVVLASTARASRPPIFNFLVTFCCCFFLVSSDFDKLKKKTKKPAPIAVHIKVRLRLRD